MRVARVVGLVLIAIAAVVVFVVLEPALPRKIDRQAVDASGSSLATQINSAIADDTLNQDSADSAPQQQVVNGWTARDLLAVGIKGQAAQDAESTNAIVGALNSGAFASHAQTKASFEQSRQTNALIALAVLALCWIGITSPRFSLSPFAEIVVDQPVGAPVASPEEDESTMQIGTSSHVEN
jgi:hypothetical protein